VKLYPFLAVVGTACSLIQAVTPEVPVNSTTVIVQTPHQDSSDVYEVEAWVNDPAPRRDARVVIYGSLIKNGVRLGGIMMQATWSEKAKMTGTPDCYVLVIYGSGVCSVEAGNFPPNQFVPVILKFQYEDTTFTGSTGFTPLSDS
jgi:hypothetical protein